MFAEAYNAVIGKLPFFRKKKGINSKEAQQSAEESIFLEKRQKIEPCLKYLRENGKFII